MEPITIFVILIAVRLGAAAAISASKYIQKKWRYIFSKHRVLIFGGKGAGKTALIHFLCNGVPYVLKEGRRIPPEPTSGPVVIGENVKLADGAKKTRANIPVDIGGDPFYRVQWREAIDEHDPDGIIYVVKGDVDDNSFRKSVEEMFDDVFSQYRGGCRNLKALHVFINFSDKWVTSRLIENQKLQAVQQFFFNRIADPNQPYQHLENINFQAQATQLSLTKSEWKETDRAIHKFGADLLGR